MNVKAARCELVFVMAGDEDAASGPSELGATSCATGDDAVQFTVADAVARSGFPRKLQLLADVTGLVVRWEPGEETAAGADDEDLVRKTRSFVRAAAALTRAWEEHDRALAARLADAGGGEGGRAADFN